MDFLKNGPKDFPGGPVAKTLNSQCRGPGSISHVATKTWCSQINKFFKKKSRPADVLEGDECLC